MTTVKMPSALIVTFLWVGFVCAISFMEAWIKFQAPGITVALGLGIGRLVFNSLNKVEWVFAFAIIINLIISKSIFSTLKNAFFFIPLILLIVQSIWLLPALDARAEMHIEGEIIPPSNLHFYYVGMEIIKVACLFIFGISLFNKKYHEQR